MIHFYEAIYTNGSFWGVQACRLGKRGTFWSLQVCQLGKQGTFRSLQACRIGKRGLIGVAPVGVAAEGGEVWPSSGVETPIVTCVHPLRP